MTTFTGTKDPSLVVVAYDPYTSVNLSTARDYYTGDTLPANDLAGVIYGAIARNVVGNAVAPDLTGHKPGTFMLDWYYRIHVIPGTLDLGNLVSSQSRDVLLWNAYMVATPMTTFDTTGMDGVSVTEPGGYTPPVDIPPLELLTYPVSIDVSGPPTIDASMTWTIDGIEYTCAIIGRRVVAFAFPPNWRDGVQETLEGKATVVALHDGSEQRTSLRDRPRRVYDFTLQLKHAEMQRFDSLVFGWQARLYAIPCWPEKATLTAQASAGATSLTLPTSYRSFAAGGLLMLYASPSQIETREIESVDGDTINLTAQLIGEWPAGSAVYPAFVAALSASLAGSRPSDRYLEVPVRFTCEPSVTPENVSGEAEATYQGVELSRIRLNWANNPSAGWESDYAMLDVGTGKFGLLGRSGFSQISRSHDWTLKGRQQIAEFRAWLKRRSGRAVPVYVPSNNADFILAADVASSDTAIDCLQNDYENQVNAHVAHRDIIIEFRDGSYLARRISSAETSEEGRTRLVFASPIGLDFTPSDVKRISYLALYRLAADAVTITHLHRGLAVASATLVNTTT